MKIPFTILLACALSGCGSTGYVVGREGAKAPGTKRAVAPAAAEQKARILVKFKTQLVANEMSAFRSMYGLRNVGMLAGLGVYLEEVTTTRAIGDVLRDLQASPIVQYAELDTPVGLDDPVN